MMVPSKALTAQNLYTIDYDNNHKENPVTVTEFKEIYDNLNTETLKRYETLSKEKKAAMKTPPAPNSP